MTSSNPSAQSEYDELAARMIAAYERIGIGQIYEADDVQDQLGLGIKRLEEMFGGADELATFAQKHPDHPAVAEYEGLRRVAANPSVVEWPNELENLEAHARVLIDAASWAPQPPHARPCRLSLGVLREPGAVSGKLPG